MSLNYNTELALINTTTNSGTITLPSATTVPGRVISFKDSVGNFNNKSLTLICDGSDTFEDGTVTKVLYESFGSIQVVASGTKWYILSGVKQNAMTISSLITSTIVSYDSLSISSITNSLEIRNQGGITFSDNNQTIAGFTFNTLTQQLVLSNTSGNRLLQFNNEIIGGSWQLTPQVFDFVLPSYSSVIMNWSEIYYTQGIGTTISWFPVIGATAYKVFIKYSQKTYLNSLTENSAIVERRSLGSPFFDFDSGLVYDTSYIDSTIETEDRANYFVYSYDSEFVRSATASTQVFMRRAYNRVIELWGVLREEFIGGSNTNDFTSVNLTNLYTNQTINILSNDFINGPNSYNVYPNIPEISQDAPIYSKPT